MQECPAATDPPERRREMFRAATAALDATGVPWCVLHGYSEYPDHIPSDVDILVRDPPEVVLRMLMSGLPTGMRLVQAMEHEPHATYFVFAAHGIPPVFLPLDVSADYRRNGRVFLHADEVLGARRRERDMWVPSAAAEFAYYVAKKVAKGQLNDAHAESLGDLFAADPAGCRNYLSRLFRSEEASIVARAAAENRWDLVQTYLPRLRQSLLSRRAPGRVHQPSSYRLADLHRRVKRVAHPTGLFVAVLGPDGAGKSTLLARLREELAPAFRRTEVYHLRPRLGGLGSAEARPDPHAAPPRRLAASVLKLGYWMTDYLIGFALRVWPRLVRSTLVLFDRYYFDLLVDARRYRYGGPQWLVRLLSFCVPSPDLTIILDVPAEVLRLRKAELTLEEARRQRSEYLRLSRELPSTYAIDASRDIDLVTADVEAVILDHMARRAAERLGR